MNSVRVNAKSESHRKPCLVEPGGMARKCVFLLGETSGVRALRGVSRGRSSVDAGRKPGGAKGQRTEETAESGELSRESGESSETRWEWPSKAASRLAAPSRMGRWNPVRKMGQGRQGL